MNDDEWVTVHAGSPWELDLFCGMLDEELIVWRRPDDVIGGIDAIVNPAGAAGKRLQVRAPDAERAAARIASHRAPASAPETDDDEYEPTAQEEVELVARWVRGASWSLVGFVLVPWLMVLYRRACREHNTESEQHALAVAAPWIAGAAILVLVFAFRVVPGWLPDRTPTHGVPLPPPPPTRIVPG